MSYYHGSKISGRQEQGVFAMTKANSKINIGLDRQTTLHVHYAFLYISQPLLHDYDMNLPNLTRLLYGVGEHNKKIIFFLFLT